VIVFALPMHPLALMLFLAYMIVRNVVGHLGFEISPAGFARHPLTRWHLTPTHHDLHHRFGKGNYGLYFSLWDEWMGTSRADYVGTHDAVTAPWCARVIGRAEAARVGLCLLLVAASAHLALAPDASPEGRWTTIDDRSGQVRSVVRVHIEDGELRGHVEKIVPRPGEEEDPVCTRVRGERRNQRVVGMQIFSGYRRDGNRWTGPDLRSGERQGAFARGLARGGGPDARCADIWGRRDDRAGRRGREPGSSPVWILQPTCGGWLAVAATTGAVTGNIMPS